ncbi:hypothetical protein [Lederbergia citrea]|nr:hypothetical protein [Lederbergia citrea]
MINRLGDQVTISLIATQKSTSTLYIDVLSFTYGRFHRKASI